VASNQNPGAIPADDENLSETFDEAKSPAQADQRRPDRHKADTDSVKPVDEAIDGNIGERFGEAVHADTAMRRREVAAKQAQPAGPPVASKQTSRRMPDKVETDGQDTSVHRDDKLDEAIDETFPASDPPAVRPGEG
jgi:hypothetical protein